MSRKIRFSSAAEKILRKRQKAFIKNFGRELSRDYKVLFVDNSDVPIQMSEEEMKSAIKKVMLAAGTPQHFIYAYEKTGFMVTENGYRNMSREDRAEYDHAIDEYFEMEKKQKFTQ
ncbi:MAG: hypothetical protein E5W38_03210 [Mesorhizobium sp.]|uniref:hypothetical protein n=1 Tax=Mesorhizobium sp. M1E.F.Ca.ET.045.02.1.1 TaxID=2493672 RepID=UPI000F760BEA|nr:hypothetical protein [Mesorhizobium sp. M1E.F.Ca.ET.045.02.1.1]AZO24854.1 hypothetical protein EJ070_32115 [Mesorhizobium sp. M1E.F.Ca.ET.045.02.1.1]TIU35102.1 MAG: hypothetical protein E5W38_03210 [Mesorhizobium sp.]